MGGMLFTGTLVYVGFLGPMFALIFPNKKRATLIFLIYIIGMLLATLSNPHTFEDLLFTGHILGFLIGASFIFLTLLYFVRELEKAKKTEIIRVRELDDLKTKFFKHISHEFRTPLSIISGMMDQILKDPENWLYKGHETISRNTNNLIKLSNRLLKVSKLEAKAMSLNLVQEDIVVYLQYLTCSFQSLAKAKNIFLKFKSSPDEIIMDFDPDKIKGIISNLLFSAIKGTPRNGVIKISITSKEIANEKCLELKIQDNSSGIPLDQQKNIVDKLYQVDNDLEDLREGAGLGLAVVNEFVDAMAGKINVEGEVGMGTTFIVQLPITLERDKMHFNVGYLNRKHPMQLPIANSVKGDKMRTVNSELLNLLIIQDSLDLGNYLENLLSNDYHVIMANSGIEGYKKALKVIPDLIISDVMQDLDGFNLCHLLKDDIRTSHIPIILLTALADQRSKLEGLDAGADVYLTKPFNNEELFVRIEKLIALRKSLQKHYNTIATENYLSAPLNKSKSREHEFIRKVRHILEEHLGDESFGVNQLCSNMSMSRSQLYRKFSSLTNTTVHQFIMTLKLKKAKELLISSDMNVSEVAFRTGFKNLSHFSRVFTKKYGFSPSTLH